LLSSRKVAAVIISVEQAAQVDELAAHALAAGATLTKAPTDAEFSTHDYWHPNIAGQATLARLVWDTLEY
jgi:lysophospholipase L1-like esterase